jgi:pheromone shutdown protein TraB
VSHLEHPIGNAQLGPRPKIILVGIGHVFDIRTAVKGVVHRFRPQTVALELDSGRFAALQSSKRGDGRVLPVTYRLLAKLQQNLAEQYGSEAGSEMIAAAEAASEIGAAVELIDMEAMSVFKRMTGAMSFKEKLMMIVGIFISLVAGKKAVEAEMEMYKSNEAGFMEEVQKSYPSIARVLIDERNAHMAERLKGIASRSSVTLAVVGDAHVPGMTLLLSNYAELEVLRLDDLNKPATEGQNAQMTVSFTVGSPGNKP